MKRYFYHRARQLGVSALFFLVAACAPQTSTPPGEIKIGIMACLTGPAAEYGQQVLDGAKLAVTAFEAAHNLKVQVVVQDTKSTPKDAISAFSTLTDVQGVKFVVGDVLSGPVAAIAPLANQKGVLVFAPGASTPALDDLDDMIFRNWVSDSYDAKVMADYSNEQRFERIAVVSVNNEWGQRLAGRFREHLSNPDQRLILNRTFSEDQADFSDIVAAIFEAKPKAIYVIGYSKSDGLFARQLREKTGGITFALLSNVAGSESQTIAIAGTALNQLVFTDPNQSPAQEWVSRYKATVGKEPGVVSAHAYDAATLLLEAIFRTSNPTPQRVADELKNVRNYPGVSGTTSLTQYGDAVKPVFLKRLQVNPDGSSSASVIKTVTP